jgi:hypothetical protein
MSAIFLSAAVLRRRQAGCPSGQRERSVKPSAQPTLVRTQHLPHPAIMPASWIFLASGLFRLCAGVCRLVPAGAAVSGDPRTYSGRGPDRWDGRCDHWSSTDGHGRAAPTGCSGWTCTAETGWYPPVVSSSVPRGFVTGAAGNANALSWSGGPACGAAGRVGL